MSSLHNNIDTVGELKERARRTRVMTEHDDTPELRHLAETYNKIDKVILRYTSSTHSVVHRNEFKEELHKVVKIELIDACRREYDKGYQDGVKEGRTQTQNEREGVFEAHLEGMDCGRRPCKTCAPE